MCPGHKEQTSESNSNFASSSAYPEWIQLERRTKESWSSQQKPPKEKKKKRKETAVKVMQLEGKSEGEKKVFWKGTRKPCIYMEPQSCREHPDRQTWQRIQEIKENERAA